ncbi:MAG: hypothetical protein IT510_05380 [Sulfuritalea sp.]|nr:hypothetical protein [Sulfuritalea sp.]
MAEAPSDQEVLTAYWVRLDVLSDAEWKSFYRLVHKALLRCPASELATLPDTRVNYIDEFVIEKLYFKAQRRSAAGIQSISGGALCLFFRRYLRDELDRYKGKSLTEDEQEEEWNAEQHDDDQLIDEFLAEIGHAELGTAIQDFLAILPDWALLMLRGHFCADDDAVPMSKLCKGIAAYHYKAQQLGVTVKKNADGLVGYEHTLIGQWMQSLGVQIIPENHALMKFLLEAICLEATAKLEGAAP